MRDYPAGTVVKVEFSTVDRNAALTDQFRAVNQAGVDPTFRVVRLANRAVYAVPGTMVQINEVAGRHYVHLDTSLDQTFFQEGQEYELRLADGEVNDGEVWVDMTHQPAGLGARFSLGTQSAGILRRQSITVLAGSIVSITDQTHFVVSIDDTDHSGYPSGARPYDEHQMTMQGTSINHGVTRRIDASAISLDDVAITINQAFPQDVSVGDRFVLLPGLDVSYETVTGEVTDVTNDAQFRVTLTGIDHSSLPNGTNVYPLQTVAFTSGENRFIGRVIKSSSTFGADVDLTFQQAFSRTVAIGDRFRLAPANQPAQAGIAHITANFAPADQDEYWVVWTLDNEIWQPDDMGGGIRTTVDILNATTGDTVRTAAAMTEVAPKLFRLPVSDIRIPGGEAASIVARGRLAGIDYEWPRTLPNMVAVASA